MTSLPLDADRETKDERSTALAEKEADKEEIPLGLGKLDGEFELGMEDDEQRRWE